MDEFSNRLKTIRKNLRITQNELAKKLSVSQNAVYNWENGKRTPSIKTKKHIAAALGVTLPELDPDTFTDIVHNTVTAAMDPNVFTGEGKPQLKLQLFSDPYYKPDTFEYNLLKHFHNLNEKGQLKAIDQVEMLSKIPEFKKD